MSSSAPHPAASEAGDLASGTCEPCRRSTPLMPADEHDTYLRRLNDGNRNPAAADEWHIEPFVGSGNVAVLQKSFTFRNFAAALRFVNRVGEVAEAQKHHPEIVLGWGHVEVAWWSHAIGGLHKNDFVCAAKTDQVLQDSAAAKTSSA